MRSESWYRSWFNSPYYHLLYRNRDEVEAANFIEQIIKYFKPEKGSKFLDLACGKGRHSIYISKKGFKVTGLDLSKSNIAYASAFAHDLLEFKVHDMRLPFRKNGFDIILNLFTSFGYFKTQEENIEVLKSAHFNLRPKGKILIDFLNANVVAQALVEKEKQEIDGVKFAIYREMKYGFITKHIRVSDGETQHEYQEKVAAITKQDFIGMLGKAGFEILDIFGSYSLDQFSEEKSPRLIIIARKTS